MSSTAVHESKQARRACHVCHDRKARFRYRGAVRADRHHVLCFACFRSERDRRRAQRLHDLPSPRPLAAAPPPGPPGERQLAHRWQMLAYLTRVGRARGETRG